MNVFPSRENNSSLSSHHMDTHKEKNSTLKLSGMWDPVLGFPVQSRQRHTGHSLAEGQDDSGIGASLVWTETERAGNVQHGGEKTQGNLSNVHKHLKGGYKKLEPGSSHWCPVIGSEVMGTN